MKRMALILCLVLTSPALAEEAEDDASPFERGTQLFLEGLLREMEPALQDLLALYEEFGPALESLMAEMGPALRQLLDEVQDWSAYHAPEILDNGDIIIRRKTPEEPQPDASDDQIEI